MPETRRSNRASAANAAGAGADDAEPVRKSLRGLRNEAAAKRAEAKARAQKLVEQKRNADGTPAAPHPSFRPHPMQGWTPDFIPKITGDAVAMKLIDRLIPIPGPEAIRCSKELAAKEGIFVGIDLLGVKWSARCPREIAFTAVVDGTVD